MRGVLKKVVDFVTFPVRSFILIEKDRFGLSSLASERFDYVAKEVSGMCLDVGCGRGNKFIKNYLNNNGVGIDVFKFEGLTEKNIVKNMTSLDYRDGTFDCATLIAVINHIPEYDREAELKEIFRCLKTCGKIIITMGNPLAEIVIHKILAFYTSIFKNYSDVDSERGMKKGEKYYLTDKEIIQCLKNVGFRNI